MDLDRLYEMVEPRYSEETGRSSINPVVRLKKVLIPHLYRK